MKVKKNKNIMIHDLEGIDLGNCTLNVQIILGFNWS
jgi:hypothetical protein